jgi:hypothetical protein
LNILDYEAKVHSKPILESVFEETSYLFFNFYKDYQPTVSGLIVPIDIDTYEGQLAMKDYLEIRVVEELMEMREAIVEGHVEEHVHEEIGDSFNFLINAYILYGWDASRFKPIEKLWEEWGPKYAKPTMEEIDLAMMEVIYYVGITCNKLKIRPWKKSQYLTDMLIFEQRFEQLFYSFMRLMFTLNISDETLWSIFSRKNQCNEFRINTGY